MKTGSVLLSRASPLLLGVLLAAFVGQPAWATDVYTWTDENGVVHFSDTRPTATDSETIQMTSSPGGVRYSEPSSGETDSADATDTPLTTAQQRRQDIAEKRLAQQERQAEIEAMCDLHAKRLQDMEPARRVYYTDENGNEVRMDDIQRVTLIEESRSYVAENCH